MHLEEVHHSHINCFQTVLSAASTLDTYTYCSWQCLRDFKPEVGHGDILVSLQDFGPRMRVLCAFGSC